jgi:hypothetical protein
VGPPHGARRPGGALQGRRLVDRRLAGSDCGQGTGSTAIGGLSGALQGPPLGRHLRRRRPGRSHAGGIVAGPGSRAGRHRGGAVAQLGGGRHHLLGRRLPGRHRGAHRPLLWGQGSRLHPPGDLARPGGDRRSLRPQRLPGHLRRIAGPAARPALAGGGRYPGLQTAGRGNAIRHPADVGPDHRAGRGRPRRPGRGRLHLGDHP